MGGETETNVSAWTIDSLKEHIEMVVECLKELVDQRFVAQEKAVTSALAASDAAITKAEANAEKWRDSANEWRGAMNDREQEFLRADAYNRAHDDLVRRVDEMNHALTEKIEEAKKTLNDKIDTLAQRVSDIAGGAG